MNITYSDVWGNGMDFGQVNPGTGSISQNPLFVSAPNNLHLQNPPVSPSTRPERGRARPQPG